MTDVVTPEWQQAVASGDYDRVAAAHATMVAKAVPKPPSVRARAKVAPADARLVKAIAQEFAKQARRIEALEKLLADKGIGAPGTVTIDPAVTDYIETRLWRTERDIEEIKNDPTLMRDGDTYVEGKGYHAGQCVTFRGSLWRAKAGTERCRKCARSVEGLRRQFIL